MMAVDINIALMEDGLKMDEELLLAQLLGINAESLAIPANASGQIGSSTSGLAVELHTDVPVVGQLHVLPRGIVHPGLCECHAMQAVLAERWVVGLNKLPVEVEVPQLTHSRGGCRQCGQANLQHERK